MSTQSLFASPPRGTEAQSQRFAVLGWEIGLFALSVILVLLAIASGLDPAYFAVSTEAGTLL